jgi:hypothetical protein
MLICEMSVRSATRTRSMLVVVAALALIAGGCADEPKLWFENQRDEVVTISIDGDRLVILRPRTWEYLPYSTAAWAWPRRIDVRTLDGRLLWSAYYDADEFARERWTIHVVQ